MRKLITGSLMLCSMLSLQAQTFVKPAMKVKDTSFAVITDEGTYQACEAELKAYQETLEKEGLPTFIVYNEWKTPEDVKKAIAKLYKKNKLEGVVFVGEIPIPMIRKAQHMTSAFKMDEKNNAWRDSSVPSDRFYDDFDLQFDFLKQDSVENNFFYYNLAVESPQRIQCDIYSARVKAIDNGEDPYAQISRYFKKTVAEHRTNNKLDQFFSYTGDGSYSNSLTAWTPETFTIREQLPGVFDKEGRARFIRYNFSAYPKDDVINMLKREDLDLSIFHEHGVPERQYLSGSPATNRWNTHMDAMKYYYRSLARKKQGNKKAFDEMLDKMKDKYGLDSTWIAGYADPKVIAEDSLLDLRTGIILPEVTDFKPNSRMVIFDACYNGDFREKDYIAGRYIMSEGKCVTTFANSVNVLQDKMANEMLGLLGMGARVGQWAKLTNILESHIIGDPTLRFQSINGVDANALFKAPYDEGRMLELLQSPYADIQNFALHNLYRNGYPGISTLLRKTFETSPFMMVRFTSLALLEKIGDKNFQEVLPLAIRDSYEFIRRTSIRMMQHVGLNEYVYPQIKAYVEDNLSERVAFNIVLGLHVFDETAVREAIDKVMAETYVLQDKEEMREALEKANNNRSMQKELLSKETAERWRILYCNSLKNYMAHACVDGLLDLLVDSNESEKLKASLLEALAWFTHSYRKPDILQACDQLRKDKNLSESLREEANRTYYRLKD
ncbi:hypothetical protein ABG827_21040 [Phocaeicola vulgatus]|uniref:hypothetical protein n=1 Tax=Bacteroides TaxID=816 RepID=UPI0001D8B4BB|nr:MULTISPECIES: hypothetical protein [Bacteroides]EFI14681.1 conserved hypothetical protein [Bacteroides sp. D22]MCE8778668.1 hypothetical protein [Bacteroides thetaiotaomicron]